ncbi:protein containing Cyclic nucleotide-binding domain protein [gut metagenome]|uniref:Protein containing Cyclic nucleotide-binding domain protein n=1 Tax=gut metagenome TaxID=749906 RepID=J9GI52_9ZZZZ
MENQEKWKAKLQEKHALTTEDLNRLIAVGEIIHYAAGTTVVRTGETDDRIFILKSGIWREYCFHNGEEATIWFSVAGEITFSVWGYVRRQPSHLYIESVTDSEVIAISRSCLAQLFETSLTFANLGRRIIEEFALLYEGWHIQMWRQNAFERYLQLFDEYPEVVSNLPLKYIASYLGITIQSLSRIRADLKKSR